MTIGAQPPYGGGGTARQHDGSGFLTLPHVKDGVDETTLLKLLASKEDISRKLYEPGTLRSQYRPWRHIVDDVTFHEVSFSKTDVELFEFNNAHSAGASSSGPFSGTAVSLAASSSTATRSEYSFWDASPIRRSLTDASHTLTARTSASTCSSSFS